MPHSCISERPKMPPKEELVWERVCPRGGERKSASQKRQEATQIGAVSLVAGHADWRD